MIILLGEVGGIEEYEIMEAIKAGKIKKPLVAWCIGTCASMFTSEVSLVLHNVVESFELQTVPRKHFFFEA